MCEISSVERQLLIPARLGRTAVPLYLLFFTLHPDIQIKLVNKKKEKNWQLWEENLLFIEKKRERGNR